MRLIVILKLRQSLRNICPVGEPNAPRGVVFRNRMELRKVKRNGANATLLQRRLARVTANVRRTVGLLLRCKIAHVALAGFWPTPQSSTRVLEDAGCASQTIARKGFAQTRNTTRPAFSVEQHMDSR